jgi:hypothetical protein
MDNAELWVVAGLGVAGSLVCWVVWTSRRDAAGKSYGPDTAMGFGMSDIGRSHSDPGTGDAGGAGPGGAGGDGGSS